MKYLNKSSPKEKKKRKSSLSDLVRKSKNNIADRVKLEFYIYWVQGSLGEVSPLDAIF